MGVIILQDVASPPAPRPAPIEGEDDAARRARWAAAMGRTLANKSQRDAARARCAWLLAVDMAEKAVNGAVFARIYSMPGKVGRGSDATTALARKIACYLTNTVGDCDVASVARAAGVNRKTVHVHVREVEDMRDDPSLDQQLDDMGRRMLAGAAALVLANLGDAA